MSTNKKKNSPWYQAGLHFKCTECGQCCRGAAGYVWLSEQEILDISSHLGLSIEEFVWKYVRIVGNRYSLIEKKIDTEQHCIFLKNNKCSIYAHRPKQCRTFPWWPVNLTSKSQWEALGETCEGVVQKEAPLVPFEEIEQQKNSYALYSEHIDNV